MRLKGNQFKMSENNFSLKEEIKKLEDSNRRDLNIIALFMIKKKPDIQSKGQLQVLIKRHLRSAKNLAEFMDNQILKACDVAERDYPKLWTIETLFKILTR